MSTTHGWSLTIFPFFKKNQKIVSSLARCSNSLSTYFFFFKQIEISFSASLLNQCSKKNNVKLSSLKKTEWVTFSEAPNCGHAREARIFQPGMEETTPSEVELMGQVKQA